MATGVRVRVFKLVESTWQAAGAGASDGRSGYTTRTPTKNEISLLVIPEMREEGFELVGSPQYAIDENPIWLWRLAEEVCKNWCVPACKYQLYVGSGPFKGLPGTCLQGPPNVQDTVKWGDKAIVEWTAVFKSTDFEALSSKIGRLRELERNARSTLMLISGHGGEGGPTRKGFTAEVVAIPEPKKTVAKAATIGAIIGVALTIFSLGAGR